MMRIGRRMPEVSLCSSCDHASHTFALQLQNEHSNWNIQYYSRGGVNHEWQMHVKRWPFYSTCAPVARLSYTMAHPELAWVGHVRASPAAGLSGYKSKAYLALHLSDAVGIGQVGGSDKRRTPMFPHLQLSTWPKCTHMYEYSVAYLEVPLPGKVMMGCWGAHIWWLCAWWVGLRSGSWPEEARQALGLALAQCGLD